MACLCAHAAAVVVVLPQHEQETCVSPPHHVVRVQIVHDDTRLCFALSSFAWVTFIHIRAGAQQQQVWAAYARPMNRNGAPFLLFPFFYPNKRDSSQRPPTNGGGMGNKFTPNQLCNLLQCWWWLFRGLVNPTGLADSSLIGLIRAGYA